MEFSFKRIGQIIHTDFILNKNNLLYGLLLLFVIVISGMTFAHIIMPHKTGLINIWMLTYTFLLLVGGSIITVLSTKDLRIHKSAIQALSLPASHLEKLVSRILYTLPFYVLGLLIVFYLCMFIYEARFNKQFTGEDLSMLNLLKTRMIPFFTAIYAILHGIFLMGSLYFKKFPFPKTVIIVKVLFFGLCLFIALIKYLSVSGQRFVDIFPETIWQTMITIQEGIPYMVFLTPVLWVLSFILLKNKQV